MPFPSEEIIDGQYIEMAMPVKNAAMSGEMPLVSDAGRDACEGLARLDKHRTHRLAQRDGVGRVVEADAGGVQRIEE